MRMRVLFGVASVVAVVGMLWGSVAPAGACSCLWPEGPSNRFFYDQAEIVALGSVVKMVRLRNPYDSADVDAVFAVDRYFKGFGPARIVADDPGDSAQCGLLNEGHVGRRLVLYFSAFDGYPFATSLCMGVTRVDAERTDAEAIAQLQAEFGAVGRAPQQGSVLERGFPAVPVALAATLGPLAFLVGAAFLWRPSRASG